VGFYKYAGPLGLGLEGCYGFSRPRWAGDLGDGRTMLLSVGLVWNIIHQWEERETPELPECRKPYDLQAIGIEGDV
jgi:hypothetical protein